jgi:acetoin utilization protein AcuB
MLVKYWMRKVVMSVDEKDSMQEAIGIMQEYHLPLLPVVRDERLVGVLTDRDLKRASASDATTLSVHELAYLISQIKVEAIMAKNPIAIAPDDTLEEAASILLKHEISGAPVVDRQGRIVGIIGQREIFGALVSLCGLEQRGVQFAFQIEDRPGSIKEVTDIVRGYGGRLVSILTSYERAPAGHRHLYVRAYNIDRENVAHMVADLKAKALMLYMVDHRENKRVEFVEASRIA